MRDDTLPPTRLRKAAALGAPLVLRPLLTLVAIVALAVVLSVWR